MKTEQEYMNDLSEIRHMMERSTKFLSLAGWSGIMAGVYALAGSFVLYRLGAEELLNSPDSIYQVIGIGTLVLILAVSTCIILSYKKAQKNNEVFWNATTRRLVLNMVIPLTTGGLFILILISKENMIVLMAPLTLIFYGLSLVNASRFTFDELRNMGIIEIILGLLSTVFLNHSLFFWAMGVGR